MKAIYSMVTYAATIVTRMGRDPCLQVSGARPRGELCHANESGRASSRVLQKSWLDILQNGIRTAPKATHSVCFALLLTFEVQRNDDHSRSRREM